MEKMNNNRARSFMQVRRSRSKRGVSPVIGVILMVAATIVIAGVVMGMLGGFKAPRTTKTIGVSTTRVNSSHVAITITSIPPGVSIESAGVSVAGNSTGGSWNNITVGSTKTVEASIGQHVVVNATFNDGTEQVILDTIV